MRQQINAGNRECKVSVILVDQPQPQSFNPQTKPPRFAVEGLLTDIFHTPYALDHRGPLNFIGGHFILVDCGCKFISPKNSGHQNSPDSVAATIFPGNCGYQVYLLRVGHKIA